MDAFAINNTSRDPLAKSRISTWPKKYSDMTSWAASWHIDHKVLFILKIPVLLVQRLGDLENQIISMEVSIRGLHYATGATM
jgi:hypothetical protein